MILPDNPKLTKLEGVIPMEGYSGNVFRISPPIKFEDGKVTEYVTSSYGLEVILGINNFAVFPSTSKGVFLTWNAIYSDGEGPEWATNLI